MVSLGETKLTCAITLQVGTPTHQFPENGEIGLIFTNNFLLTS